MAMTNPHHSPHHEFEELSSALASVVDRGVAAERPATPPPGGSAGGGRVANVGPPQSARAQVAPLKPGFTPPPRNFEPRQRLTSPMEQWVEVVEEAYRLKQEVELLIAAVTGEVPVAAGRMTPIGPVCGLLPNVDRLFAEVSAVHGQISDRVEQARERLG